MFEVPQAKRINRSEYLRQGSDDDSEYGSSVRGEQHPGYNFQYDLVDANKQGSKPSTDSRTLASTAQVEDTAEDDTYEFRLFASTPKDHDRVIPKSSTATETDETNATRLPGLSKIQIRSSTPLDEVSLSTCSFASRARPQSYYFTSALPPEEYEALQRRTREVAMSADDIHALSETQSWPGMAYSWKVIHLHATTAGSAGSKISSLTTTNRNMAIKSTATRHQLANRRPKPSKKRRITLRRRIADIESATKSRKAVHSSKSSQQKADKSAQSVELTEGEKEKRTRRNREKKVKRKEREKRKKLEAVEPQQGETIGNKES